MRVAENLETGRVKFSRYSRFGLGQSISTPLLPIHFPRLSIQSKNTTCKVTVSMPSKCPEPPRRTHLRSGTSDLPNIPSHNQIGKSQMVPSLASMEDEALASFHSTPDSQSFAWTHGVGHYQHALSIFLYVHGRLLNAIRITVIGFR
jgi:hypothetical protein